MTETTDRPAIRTNLGSLNVSELKGVAGQLGISGTAKMRKGDLVAAIEARQGGASAPRSTTTATHAAPASSTTDAPTSSDGTTAGSRRPRRAASSGVTAPAATPDAPSSAEQGPAAALDAVRDLVASREDRRDERRDERQDASRDEQRSSGGDRPNDRSGDRGSDRSRDGERQGTDRSDRGDRQLGNRSNDRQNDRSGERTNDRQNDRNNNDRQNDRTNDRQQGGQGNQQGGYSGNQGGYRDDDGQGGSRRRNRQRGRKRGRNRDGFGGQDGGSNQNDTEVQIAEDDVLVPVAGILDVLDNYAFVRTSGYLPASNDVYVPLAMVKRYGLRKGDAVTGAIKAGGGEQHTHNRQKYTPLARLDTINGKDPEASVGRADFGKLTPLYPQQRLRLETAANILTTRMIDLVAPIGKGQRGLIVAPAKAGKTMVMQAIANAITTNNPECHLMVVLVDERPEEVTDMQRAVKGEVIASTFDRPATDHTIVAELAIERAKRLVELGHDVVVLLDSITKLGRAYNLAAPASGRIMSGGVDSAALYPPKRFFGAARNIEHGGSLTIIATALVETGSKMDEVIFEEFKGTGNMELKLDRQLANRRIFPAVDVNNSGTRREEILLAPEELKIMWKLRRVLAALDQQAAVELLLDRLKKTKTNYEFLVQVQQNSSIKLDDED